MVAICCENLSVRFGRRTIIKDASVTLSPGRLIGMIGPNGAGKSTFLRALVGLQAPYKGKIEIDGVDLAEVNRRKLAMQIAYLPQGQTIHWPVTVRRLVSLGRLPHLAPMSKVSADDEAAIDDAMARCHVAHFSERVATELSGGERARVMLARALAVGAPGLLVDEPLAALDPGHQIDVISLLGSEARAGKLVVVVLHDLTIAARYCDRLLLINEGHLVADGEPEAVLRPDRLASVYGITASINHDDGGAYIVPKRRIA